MPRDGCRECSRRRIKCDKGNPECAKCLKKGIKCSGIGRHIRFVSGVAVRGKHKGQSFPLVERLSTAQGRTAFNGDVTTVRQSHESDRQVTLAQTAVESSPSSSFTDYGSVDDISQDFSEDSVVLYRSAQQLCEGEQGSMFVCANPRADLSLEHLKPGIRMLFSHCRPHESVGLLY